MQAGLAEKLSFVAKQNDNIEKRQDRLEKTVSAMVNGTSGGAQSNQPHPDDWLKFEGLFPMKTMQQFNEFEKALKDSRVCIV